MKKAKKAREFSREFKVAAVRRILAGESVAALSRELEVRRKLLYEWKQRMEEGGEANLHARAGRPPKTAGERQQQREAGETHRLATLERLVGKQQALIDFFGRALQAVEQLPGVKAGKARSTKASGKRGSKKA
jgi:transposase